MNKPITVVYEEFKQELADIINNSGLKPFMIEFVLTSYLNEVKAASAMQYQHDKAQYEQQLKKEQSQKKELKDVDE